MLSPPLVDVVSGCKGISPATEGRILVEERREDRVRTGRGQGEDKRRGLTRASSEDVQLLKLQKYQQRQRSGDAQHAGSRSGQQQMADGLPAREKGSVSHTTCEKTFAKCPDISPNERFWYCVCICVLSVIISSFLKRPQSTFLGSGIHRGPENHAVLH